MNPEAAPEAPRPPASNPKVKRLHVILSALGVVLLIGLLVFEALRTRPIRRSLSCYTELIAAADRGDLERVRALCSEDYLAAGGPELAPEGGLVGLPRTVSKNFRAWRDGPEVLLCPTGRTGVVLRFVKEPEGWRFDGLDGLREARPGPRALSY